MRRSPAWRLVSLKVPDASTATYASYPLPAAAIAGNAAQTSSDIPAKISFWRSVRSMAFETVGSSNAFTVERSMIFTPGSASTSSGNVGPHMLSRAVVVTMMGRFNALAAFRQRRTLSSRGPRAQKSKKWDSASGRLDEGSVHARFERLLLFRAGRRPPWFQRRKSQAAHFQIDVEPSHAGAGGESRGPAPQSDVTSLRDDRSGQRFLSARCLDVAAGRTS